MTITHENIYERFLIEYDKANITSSYPSLTKHEAVALLNKAYTALISRKLTGNNPRKAPFELDIKAIEDLQPLVTTTTVPKVATYGNNGIRNERVTELPDEMMYYLQSYVVDSNDNIHNVDLITHQMAQNFKVVANNVPWIENPVAYLENSCLHILADIDIFEEPLDPLNVYITYIKIPEWFEVEEVNDQSQDQDPGDSGSDDQGGSGDQGGGDDQSGSDDQSGNDDVPTITLNIVDPTQPQIQNFSDYGFTQQDLEYAANGTTQFQMDVEGTITKLKIVPLDAIPEMNSSGDLAILPYTIELNQATEDFSIYFYTISYVAYMEDEEDISAAAPLIFFSITNKFVNCIEPHEDV